MSATPGSGYATRLMYNCWCTGLALGNWGYVHHQSDVFNAALGANYVACNVWSQVLGGYVSRWTS
jgi:hypothetical protein